jgi:uncharacterized RDD family membrane protein YckC
MQNVYHVQTPENVSLEFELAGPGSRGVAVAIDMLIQGVFLIIVSVILLIMTGESQLNLMLIQDNSVYVIIGLLLIFVMQFGYFFLFEAFMKGATPGKKIVGLNVMMANGEPLSVTASLIRNLIRIGDMLPGIYAVGIFSVVFTQRFMRIGDLAANTVVVKKKKGKNAFGVRSTSASEHRNPILSPREEALLREYWERRRSLRNPLNYIPLEAQLYHHFYTKVGLVPNLPNNFTRKQYLEQLMVYVGIV